MNPITTTPEVKLFNHLNKKAPIIREEVQHLKNIALTQKDILLRTIAQHSKDGNVEFIEASRRMYDKLLLGANFSDAVAEVKPFLPNSAAIIAITKTANGPPAPPSSFAAAPTAASENNTNGGACSA